MNFSPHSPGRMEILEISPGVRHIFEQMSNVSILETSLKHMTLFQGIGDEALSWLARQIRSGTTSEANASLARNNGTGQRAITFTSC